ncbi:tRNA methyltransferase 10 homolog A-like [Diadema setosum]|uniref:tRNA methyltransferase 10 homolog A-like n=1 Tax=Diadema setosum TaxID=31175 RepID=UPI003B3A908C
MDDANQENDEIGKQDQDEVTDSVVHLSKNQLKKQLRLQRWAETKKERRKKEREKIKVKKRMLMEERQKEGLEYTGIKKKKMSDPEASDIRVAIDCAYDDLMSESDIKKLIKQIQRCYAENRKSAKPLQFYLSSLNNKTRDYMSTLVQGYKNWDVHLKSDDPEGAFGADSIVYLAAESPNVLQQLHPDKVYIIGGLVDHNHHKGVCFEKVRERGWNHAQLPIGDYVKLKSRKVLAVNHVYEIILAYVQVGNWADAFNQVLPNRKVTEFLPANGANEEESESLRTRGERDAERNEQQVPSDVQQSDSDCDEERKQDNEGAVSGSEREQVDSKDS